MAKQILPKSKKQKRRPKTKPRPSRADLSEVLCLFAEARAFIYIGLQRLEDDENDAVAPEALCIRHGLTLFDSAVSQLDLAGGAQ